MTSIERQLETMTPGECRWVAKPGIHVYCWGSRVGGKYRPDVKVFAVRTAKSQGSVWDAEWLPAREAAKAVARLEPRF